MTTIAQGQQQGDKDVPTITEKRAHSLPEKLLPYKYLTLTSKHFYIQFWRKREEEGLKIQGRSLTFPLDTVSLISTNLFHSVSASELTPGI